LLRDLCQTGTHQKLEIKSQINSSLVDDVIKGGVFRWLAQQI
jgi:hypothetical protein